MALLTVVGMDPSLRHWGMCKGTYDTETKELKMPEADLVVTEPAPKNRKTPKNLYDIADAKELMVRAYKFAKGADVICVECPVGSQSASAMLGYGICVALIACLQCAGLDLIITTPMQGKAVVTGVTDSKANAALNITKKEVINWVAERHPEMPFPRYKRNGEMLISMDPAEHMADSVIAVYAGMSTSEFAQVIHAVSSTTNTLNS